MDFLLVSLAYLAALMGFIFVMLFGESPAFAGTPVSAAHWLLAEGILDGIWWLVSNLCGSKGTSALGGLEKACCQRPNPVFQVFYLALVGACYYLYIRDIFSLLPLPGIPTWHRSTGAVTVAACLFAFTLASISDSGTVTAANLEAHLALYPYDGVTSMPKECWTCHLQRPARSKHCPVCNRCVARFDHHCAWVNNCIGLANMRYFLLFLAANAALCLYGGVLGAAILAGEVERRNIRQARYTDGATGETRPVGNDVRIIAQWLAFTYPVPVVVTVFLLGGVFLVGSFLVYHLWLLARGTTSYEAMKVREIVDVWRQQQATAG